MNEKLSKLCQRFMTVQNLDDAPIMKAYMQNQFEFFGVKKPARLKVGKYFYIEFGKPTIEEIPTFVQFLWQQPERELQYFGNDINETFVKKFPKTYLKHIEYCITHKSWWDTVDTLAIRVVGEFFKLYPELILPTTEIWMKSENIWLQRVCIIFQLKYKDKTDVVLLFKHCKLLGKSEAFFIQKAIGWALREYSKTDKAVVINFVHKTTLSDFSKKEALKWLKKKDFLI
jgi:3-methyladenine DNA glycosylase AlkD